MVPEEKPAEECLDRVWKPNGLTALRLGIEQGSVVHSLEEKPLCYLLQTLENKKGKKVVASLRYKVLPLK